MQQETNTKVSKLIDKHYILQKIHNKGVKDQLSDQKDQQQESYSLWYHLLVF